MSTQTTPDDAGRERFWKARVRFRMRQESENRDDNEHTGGELNLVPYMDILVNTLIFLLASTAVAMPLAHIRADSPAIVPEDNRVAHSLAPPPRPRLTVAISERGFILGSVGGVIRHADGSLPTLRCQGPFRDRPCFAASAAGDPARSLTAAPDRYDYEGLRRLAVEIKRTYPSMRDLVLTADRRVPYRVVIRTLDTLRGKPSSECQENQGCLFDRVSFSAGVD